MMINAKKKNKAEEWSVEERWEEDFSPGVHRQGFTRESFEKRPGGCERVNPADIMGWREFQAEGTARVNI